MSPIYVLDTRSYTQLKDLQTCVKLSTPGKKSFTSDPYDLYLEHRPVPLWCWTLSGDTTCSFSEARSGASLLFSILSTRIYFLV